MTADDPKVKGVVLRSALKALEQVRGVGAVEATIRALPKELGDQFRYGGIVASRWYPLEWYRALHAAMVLATNEGDRLIRDVEREAARADMTGVYRLAFKLLSPQTLVAASGRLFSTYYDTGRVETLEARTGYVRMRWSECAGFNRSIWLGLFASCELLLEMAGANAVRLHVRAGGKSEDFAEAEAFWT